MAGANERFLLPKTVAPVHYNLHIKPDFTAFTFEGQVEVILKVFERVSTVSLNSAELTFRRSTIRDESVCEDNAEQEIPKVEFDEPNDVAKLFLPIDLIPAHSYKLSISYTGILNDQMKGFYRAQCPDGTFMGVTQFEPVDARRALPCWDEPGIKATFAVSLTRPTHFQTISNMPILESIQSDNVVKDVFDTTPVMSTYLLAWVVGEFDMVEGRTTGNTLIRVFTPPKKGNQGKFALEVAIRTLPLFEKYFEIDYPLAKCDLLAIANFAAGAMENWGCITYRETAILIDEQFSGQAARQRVALVVAHELAHQWFGNLVTMEWWDDLWLNEGFACWIEYMAVDKLFPEWNIFTTFVGAELSTALSLDALQSSHPVQVDLSHAHEVDQIFDAISYSKGASLIRMLETHLTPEMFRKGLVQYLNKFAYRNAVTNDLWQALGSASGIDVKTLMNKWTSQIGYPVLSVSLDHDKNLLMISQRRFLASGPIDDNSIWPIPLQIRLDTTDSVDAIISTTITEAQSTISLPNNFKFVKVNALWTVPCRILYSAELLAKLQNIMPERNLHAIDRLNIQNDNMALARAGMMPTVDATLFLRSYANDNEQNVLSDVASSIIKVSPLLHNTDAYKGFSKFVRDLFRPTYDRIGWQLKKDETYAEQLLRSVVLKMMVSYDDEDAITEGCQLFDLYNKTGDGLSADTKSAAYIAVAKRRKMAGFDSLITQYRNAEMAAEKIQILLSIGHSSDIDILRRFLEFGLTDEVKTQDFIYVASALASKPVGMAFLWEFYQTSWDDILMKRFPGGFITARLVKTLGAFNSREKAKEIEMFFSVRKSSAIDRSVEQTLESIESKAQWAKQATQTMIDCFQSL